MPEFLSKIRDSNLPGLFSIFTNIRKRIPDPLYFRIIFCVVDQPGSVFRQASNISVGSKIQIFQTHVFSRHPF